MIKGINHTIIELSETGNEYYERALLIIRPAYASVQRAILEEEARKMLKNMDAPSILRSKKGKFRLLLLCAGCILLGLMAGVLLR